MDFHTARRVILPLIVAGVAAVAAWPAALTAQAPAARASSGPLPRTKADAEKWLRERGLGIGPQSLTFYLALGSNWSADAVRMMLLSGASATKPDLTGDHPMSALAVSCDGQAAAAEIGEVLLQAGASADVVESSPRKATPAMAAVMCPALLKVILSKKPNLNAVDANNLTAMDYAIRFGKPREEVMRLLVEGGFDVKRWRAALLENYSDAVDKIIESLAPAAPGPDEVASGNKAVEAALKKKRQRK